MMRNWPNISQSGQGYVTLALFSFYERVHFSQGSLPLESIYIHVSRRWDKIRRYIIIHCGPYLGN